MFRANSILQGLVGEIGIAAVEYGAGAIQRILPHVDLSAWHQVAWAPTDSVWTDQARTNIRITLGIGAKTEARSRALETTVERRRTEGFDGTAGRVLDTREHQICRLIAEQVSRVSRLAIDLRRVAISDQHEHYDEVEAKQVEKISLQAMQRDFDEGIVARHIQMHHGLKLDVLAVFSALHTLAEQSYENKALTFGCLLNPRSKSADSSTGFPKKFLSAKKYKALSDGYRTAYEISCAGSVTGFSDLSRYSPLAGGGHYFPAWCEDLARASRNKVCGIALSRQGDILVFDEGTLRFTYRYGRWQYWNHSHLVNLLSDTARAQHVLPAVRSRVVGAVYRAALDVSFHRSGGLFVILRNRNHLDSLVRIGDAIGDRGRSEVDDEFDDVVKGRTIQTLPRNVVVELASLDGAVIIANSGHILAYGAVLAPRKVGRLKGTEGSRTKAAIGASNYGLAVKISSDGEISVYHKGREFMRI